MPHVKSNVIINAPIDLVWELAQDVEKFPSIMPDLMKVEIIEKTNPSPQTVRTVTEWHGRIAQFNRNIVWTEEDIWNQAEKTCHFWQLKGDFTLYKGDWKFKAVGNTTQLDLAVEYSFEVPLIGAILKGVLQKLMQQNANMMSESLKAEAERRMAM